LNKKADQELLLYINIRKIEQREKNTVGYKKTAFTVSKKLHIYTSIRREQINDGLNLILSRNG